MIAGIAPIDGKLFGDSATNGVGPLRGALASEDNTVGTSFVDMLREAATRTVGTLERSEHASIEALQGGDIQTREVVDAVMSAEQSLQAAIAIRDKIVTAYLEISRMAI
jgi:flagellar hook-basal body complex protein FliE